MRPGTNLDVRIARDLLGCECENRVCMCKDAPHGVHHTAPWGLQGTPYVKPYSYSWDLSKEVVDHMKSLGWRLYLQTPCGHDPAGAAFQKGIYHPWVIGEQVPHAICLAALAALELPEAMEDEHTD
jgi:hypothetical protein